MAKMKRKMYGMALVWMLSVVPLAVAANPVIRGEVRDDAGRPLRGAIITATAGNRSVSRYSDSDGKYEIMVPSGTYDVAVHAFGFGVKWQPIDTKKVSTVDFKLASGIDVGRLSPDEIQSVLPDNAETKFLIRECEGCHHLQTIARLRGLTAAEWKAFLPVMPQGRVVQPRIDPQRMDSLSKILEKYFGPMSPYFGPDSAPPKPEQIERVKLSDAALNATVTEYTIPTLGAMPNEVRVDSRDHVWFGDVDATNELGELDPASGQFHMFPLELPNSYPISGLVDKDGSIWWSLLGSNMDDKMINIIPETGKITYYRSENPAWVGHGPHSMVFDAQGNIWSCGHDTSVLDPRTKTFRVYPLPPTKIWPEGSIGPRVNLPGLPELAADSEQSTSSIAIDSKGMIYLTRYYQATIMQFDPATGKTKDFRAPGMVSPRGVDVDSDDNIWFGDAFGHQIGKLDPRTGAVKLYHAPSEKASPYAANIERRTGYIYFADDAGNKVTRFDPKTETFIEYPLPTAESYARFLDFDSKGRIWYGAGDPFGGKIGVIDPGPTQSTFDR